DVRLTGLELTERRRLRIVLTASGSWDEQAGAAPPGQQQQPQQLAGGGGGHLGGLQGGGYLGGMQGGAGFMMRPDGGGGGGGGALDFNALLAMQAAGMAGQNPFLAMLGAGGGGGQGQHPEPGGSGAYGSLLPPPAALAHIPPTGSGPGLEAAQQQQLMLGEGQQPGGGPGGGIDHKGGDQGAGGPAAGGCGAAPHPGYSPAQPDGLCGAMAVSGQRDDGASASAGEGAVGGPAGAGPGVQQAGGLQWQGPLSMAPGAVPPMALQQAALYQQHQQHQQGAAQQQQQQPGEAVGAPQQSGPGAASPPGAPHNGAVDSALAAMHSLAMAPQQQQPPHHQQQQQASGAADGSFGANAVAGAVAAGGGAGAQGGAGAAGQYGMAPSFLLPLLQAGQAGAQEGASAAAAAAAVAAAAAAGHMGPFPPLAAGLPHGLMNPNDLLAAAAANGQWSMDAVQTLLANGSMGQLGFFGMQRPTALPQPATTLSHATAGSTQHPRLYDGRIHVPLSLITHNFGNQEFPITIQTTVVINNEVVGNSVQARIVKYKKHKRPNHFNYWITGLQKTLSKYNDVRQAGVTMEPNCQVVRVNLVAAGQ
ncbi:hypothetical protein TSOC_014316, partial [Tetrabaena socialis]